MNARMARTVLLRLLGTAAATVLMTCLLVPVLAPKASACDVSIGYRPTISIDKPNLGLSKPCSNGDSLTGVAIVTVATLSALAMAGIAAFRRGEALVKASQAHQSAALKRTLTTYLEETGIVTGNLPARHEGNNNHAQ